MADVGLSPRVNNASGLGEKDYRWKEGYINNLYCANYMDADGKKFASAPNVLEREKSYSVGDIAYSSNLHSYLYLKCIGAGTTGTDEPTLNTVGENDVVTDGSAVFKAIRVDSRADIIPDTSVMMSMPPAHYSRSEKWKAVNNTSLLSPSRLWVNIDDAGLMLSNNITFNLNEDSVWDTKATEWEASKAYNIDDVVYPAGGKTGYYYKCTYAGTSSPFGVTFNTTIGGETIDASVKWETIYDYTYPSNRKGKDFYVYACINSDNNIPDIMISDSSIMPIRYSASTSRKIGGFHCLCADVGTISGHTLSGYVAGDILPCSVWDLLHRPVADPEGMVYDEGTGRWYDIYLPSYSNGKLQSVFGGIIADGTSTVKFNGEKFAEEFGKVGKRLIARDEFIVVAKGSNEGTNIYGSADPVTTGGHKDTANMRMISNIGMEDCCGAMWQFVTDTYEAMSTSWTSSNFYMNSYSWQTKPVYNPDVDSKQYGQCHGLLRRGIVGSSWSYGAYCGSRGSYFHCFSAYCAANIAGRGASEPRVANF